MSYFFFLFTSFHEPFLIQSFHLNLIAEVGLEFQALEGAPATKVPLLLTARETSLVGPFTSDPVLLLGSSGGNATHECRFLP